MTLKPFKLVYFGKTTTLSKATIILFLDPELIDPICEGGLSVINNNLLFTNPQMKYSRSNLTLYYKKSLDMSWNQIQITNPTVLSDYSVISQTSITINGSKYIGLVWGSCRYPFSFRPWCILGWEIEFTYIPLDSLKYDNPYYINYYYK